MSRDRAWSSQFGGFRILGFGCRFGTRLVFDKGFLVVWPKWVTLLGL